jgi:hypothetical protein
MAGQLISKEGSARILDAAHKKYGSSQIYEYRKGGNGIDTDGNEIPEIDCSHLVYGALIAVNIKIPYTYVVTSALNSDKSEIYYGNILPEEVLPGDLIVFDGHVGIVESIFYDEVIQKLRGTFFHSESYSDGPTTTGFVVDPTSIRRGYEENYYGSKKKPIKKFLRPRSERSVDKSLSLLIPKKTIRQMAGAKEHEALKWESKMSSKRLKKSRRHDKWRIKTINDCTDAVAAKWQKVFILIKEYNHWRM